jgi:Flp pilus assembly protein TadB
VTLVVLVILAVVWAVYLVSWVRSRTEHRRVNSINSFSNHLSVLERTAPGGRSPGRPLSGSPTTGLGGQGYFAPRRPTMSQTKKRRRDILVGLLGATGVTFLGMVLLGGMVTYLFGLSLVLTVAYVMALANLQKQAIERRSKVRYLDGTAVAPAAWAGPEWTADDEGTEYAYPSRQIYAVGGR